MEYLSTIIGAVGLGLAWLFYIKCSELSMKMSEQLVEFKSLSGKMNDQLKEFKSLSGDISEQLDELRSLDKEMIKKYKRQENMQKWLQTLEMQIQKTIERAPNLTPSVQSLLSNSITGAIKNSLLTNDLEDLVTAQNENSPKKKNR